MTFIIDKTGLMFITGSKVVKAALSIDISDDELGGSATHSFKSGVAHFRNADEKECYKRVRKLLDYIPHWNNDPRSRRPFEFTLSKVAETGSLLPVRPRQGYDIRKIIDCIVDDNSFFEVHSEFAQNIVTGFAYIEGLTVGVIANQPDYLGGIIDCDASDKAARFIRYCDSFNVPLLTLVDTPGFLPGPDEETKGIIRHGAKLIFAYAESTVPKVTFIIRKAYGGAYIAMCSKHLGADFVYAWRNAEIAVMGPEGAVQILFSKELAAHNDSEYIINLQEKYKKEYMNPQIAAENGYITETILPEKTRSIVVKCFQLLMDKKIKVLKKKHGNIPL